MYEQLVVLLSRLTTSKRESDGSERCYRSYLQRVVHQPVPRVPPGPAVALPIQDKVGQHEVAILMACTLRIGDGPWKTSVGSFLIPGRNVNLALDADAACLYNIGWLQLGKVPHPPSLADLSLISHHGYSQCTLWRRNTGSWGSCFKEDIKYETWRFRYLLSEYELGVQAHLIP